MRGKNVIVITSVGTARAVPSFLSDTPCDNEPYGSFCLFFKLLKATTSVITAPAIRRCRIDAFHGLFIPAHSVSVLPNLHFYVVRLITV